MENLSPAVNRELQTIGAWYAPPGSEFVVWSPCAEKVELLIQLPSLEEDPEQDHSIFYHDGRPWRVHSMAPHGVGYWRTILPVPLGTRYYYRIDGDAICPDPASFGQPAGVHGPSELVERRSFSWTDNNWKGLPLASMIIYELHTGCFSPTHDFQGVIDKLDYLSDLGITAIELMPLAQFPGSRNWGYDGVYPFAIHPAYGGVQGLRKLVNAAHGKGIAVIVDVVYNHFGPEGSYGAAFGPLFTEKYRTPWGSAVNFDDAWSDGVRNYFLQHARMLLEDHHVDGLRLDAVHAIKDDSAHTFLQELKTLTVMIGQRTDRHKVLIAENDLNDPIFIDPPSRGGYNLDGQWIDEFHHALRAYLTGERQGYLEDFGDLAQLGKAFARTYVYDGVWSPHRKRTFGGQAVHNPFYQFVVFSQNHDQIGNRAEGDRLSSQLSLEQLKLVAATVLLSPYIPLLFMGEEYGEQNPFQYFVSFTDPQLIANIRTGRKREFAGFIKDGDIPDPESEDTFLRSNLSWDHASDRAKTLLGWYRMLMAFRKTRPAMQSMTRGAFRVHRCKDDVLCLERSMPPDKLYIFLNFSDKPSIVPNDTQGILFPLIDSAAPEWLGAFPRTMRMMKIGEKVTLSPYSCLVCELRPDGW
jgi:maltooligosyltrehalose trehalohydrolase